VKRSSAAPRLPLPSCLQSASDSLPGGGSLSLTVGEVEVAEHLPFPAPASPASSCSATSGWLPAEEMARVPGVLSSAQRTAWPVPTSAGERNSESEGQLRSFPGSQPDDACSHSLFARPPHTAASLPPGDYPLPDPAAGLGIGDTLAQLSDLSQATVYQSVTVLEVQGDVWGRQGG
jgi:hypothetical protein